MANFIRKRKQLMTNFKRVTICLLNQLSLNISSTSFWAAVVGGV